MWRDSDLEVKTQGLHIYDETGECGELSWQMFLHSASRNQDQYCKMKVINFIEWDVLGC